MFEVAGCRNRKFHGFALAVVVFASVCFAGPALSETRGAPHAVTFLVGRGTDTDFTQIISQPWTTNFVDLTMLGVTASARLGTISELVGSDLGHFGNYVSIETEAGAAYRFGEESQGEFWGSLYFCYDGFPWNDTVYTTAAINTGLSILTETSQFERDRSNDQSSLVLHNFSPEITIADPDNKNLEFVLRLHHRSGIFGAIDDVHSGSTFVATGIRFRF